MLLLVLRGLLGPSVAAAMGPTLPAAQGATVAIAMQHAPTQTHAQGSAVADDFTVAAASPCHNPAPPSANQGESSCVDGGADNACTACAQCDICHSALLQPSTPRGPRASADSVLHASAATAFANAPAALAIKPPIF